MQQYEWPTPQTKPLRPWEFQGTEEQYHTAVLAQWAVQQFWADEPRRRPNLLRRVARRTASGMRWWWAAERL